jgi:ketosteroid isomerase-like protein
LRHEPAQGRGVTPDIGLGRRQSGFHELLEGLRHDCLRLGFALAGTRISLRRSPPDLIFSAASASVGRNKLGGSMPSEDLLLAYCRAFGARDASAVAALFEERGLYELPLLGQRLVGPAEIRVGLERAFAMIERCAIEIADVKSSPRIVIAEGRLTAKLHRDATPMDAPLAIVAECRDARLSRLATHLDARPYRLWSDGPIFAVAS